MRLCLPNDDLQKEIVQLFKNEHNHIGLAIKTRELLKKLSTKCLPQAFRDILGEIRRNNVTGDGFIVSDVHIGYWYTEDKEELNDFLQKQLNRIANQYANVEPLHLSLKSHKSKQETTKQIFIEFSETNQYQTI